MSELDGSGNYKLLSEVYSQRYASTLVPMAFELEGLLRSYLEGIPHIDRIAARAKSIRSFLAKAGKRLQCGSLKYEDPLNQVQDQIGARLIVFYLSDVDVVSEALEKYLRIREARIVEPDSESSFTYFGKHYILSIPREAVTVSVTEVDTPEVFELQIKTLFQHAWSEAGHDLAYKPPRPLTALQRRQLAFTSAQAWGADRVYDELYAELYGASSLSVVK